MAMEVAREAEGLITPFIGSPCRFWNYVFGLQFELDLEALKDSMAQLLRHRDRVRARVVREEGQMLKCLDAVDEWFQTVSSVEKDVSSTIDEGSKRLNKCCCLGLFWPWTWWGSQSFINKLRLRTETVKKLQSAGSFTVVTENQDERTMQVFHQRPPVGMEEAYNNVKRQLKDDGVAIIAVHGMAGVGKTTLLRKINNEYAMVDVEEPSTSHFVIWLEIAEEGDPMRVQNGIGKRLKLQWGENKDLQSRAEHLRGVLGKMKFMLLLDDIREVLNLWEIGVPYLIESKNSSKIVFTTRKESLCVLMDADRNMRLECLNTEDAWELFQQRVGKKALNSHWDIPRLARLTSQLCLCLPLVIILVARTMATKYTREEWLFANSQLKISVAAFTNMEEDYFPISKYCYDDLQSESIKVCFLFCSLYPQSKPIPIEGLIQKWIGEGYINSFMDWEEAVNMGYNIIGALKESGLLESADGCIQMDNVLREFALWIGRDDGQNINKVLVNTGAGLEGVPGYERWKEAGTISLTDTKIRALRDKPECPRLSTLLLFGNSQMTEISDGFFGGMPTLKILDLSGSRVIKLPTSVDQLLCLEYLDISGTCIIELCCELKGLNRLKYLFMELNDNVPQIPAGVIQQLQSLEILRLGDNSFGNRDDEKLGGIKELASLKNLKILDFQIHSLQVLKSFLGNRQLLRRTRALFVKLDSISKILKFELSSGAESSSSSSPYLVVHCSEENDDEVQLFWNLETLHLQCLPLVSWKLNEACTPRFRNLRSVYLHKCELVLNVEWVLLAPFLQKLEIEYSKSIKEIISSQPEASGRSVPGDAFSNLEVLILVDLPALESICRHPLLFRSLREITVVRCPMLRRLPLVPNCFFNYKMQKLQSIRGSEDWWNNLMWNETPNQTLTRLFSTLS